MTFILLKKKRIYLMNLKKFISELICFCIFINFCVEKLFFMMNAKIKGLNY